MAEETVTAEQSVALAGTNVPLGKGAAEIVMRQCLSSIAQTVDSLIAEYERNNDPDAPFEEQDANDDAINALLLVHDEIRRAAASDTAMDRIVETWWRIRSVVGMVAATHPDASKSAGYITEALLRELRTYPGLWSHVEWRGEHLEAQVERAVVSGSALVGTVAQQ
ncbi:MAG: hypothetical protein EPN34_06995 [Burkholderiaceae bacterium]|nr:MAG: hypothetical protein EPN34_06995 [Burkholderiaceae bacterium]